MITSQLQHRIESLALALRRASARRGRPCLIRSADLVQLGPGELSVDAVGIIGRSTFHMRELYRALGGRAGWGSAPTYTRGVWAL